MPARFSWSSDSVQQAFPLFDEEIQGDMPILQQTSHLSNPLRLPDRTSPFDKCWRNLDSTTSFMSKPIGSTSRQDGHAPPSSPEPSSLFDPQEPHTGSSTRGWDTSRMAPSIPKKVPANEHGCSSSSLQYSQFENATQDSISWTVARVVDSSTGTFETLNSSSLKRTATGALKYGPCNATRSFPPPHSVLNFSAHSSNLSYTDEEIRRIGEGALRGVPFTREEDQLIKYLKEVKGIKWADFPKYFPYRSQGSVQTHYSKKLANREVSRVSLNEDAFDSSNPAKKRPVRESSKIAAARNHELITNYNHHIKSYREPIADGGSVDSLGIPETIATFCIEPEESKHRRGYASQAPPLIGDSVSRKPSSKSTFPKVRRKSSRLLHLELEKDKAALIVAESPALKSALASRPYLSNHERECLKGAQWDDDYAYQWEGSVVHVDLSMEELQIVEEWIAKAFRGCQFLALRSHAKRIREMMSDATEAQILAISWRAKASGRLNRTRESIEAFLRDAAEGLVAEKPRFSTLFNSPDSITSSRWRKTSTASLLRHRELGYSGGSHRTDSRLPVALQNAVYDTLGPSLSFTGSSGDVNTVAWAPDGRSFAAGSACLVDPDSMQYNEPNNLLYGDVDRRVLIELPDHHIARDLKRPASGVNSSHSMHVSQDPRLFTTVSMVDFSPDGDVMYSVGYDAHLRIWDTQIDKQKPTLLANIKHPTNVDLLAVSSDNMVATGCQRTKTSVFVTKWNPDTGQVDKLASFASQKAREKKDKRIHPSSLRFNPWDPRYLLAGFSSNSTDEDRGSSGEACLWDIAAEQQVLRISANTQAVFDCAWNPNRAHQRGLFALGCVAGNRVNRGMKSVIRLYDPRASNPSTMFMFMEMECPAWDMNDVLFNPYDENYIAAGCTDASVYIWDSRNPDDILHTLQHGQPLIELSDAEPQERLDTGIRFCAWGQNRSRLFSGSSDGVVKIWDPYLAREDVLVKDIVTLNSGVMCGAFNSDFSSLLIGEVNGSINTLNVGREDVTFKDVEKFRLISQPAPRTQEYEDEESGIRAAADLLSMGQMELRPLGALPIRQAVQGENYAGPFDNSTDAPHMREDARKMQEKLQTDEHAEQQCELSGCRHSEIKFTSEESGDSKRSQDRIPDILRSAKHAELEESILPLGMVKCARCGLPARIRVGQNVGSPQPQQNADATSLLSSTLAFPTGSLCERCDFTCFRCGEHAVVRKDATIRCRNKKCGCVWRADVLGYKLLKDKLKRDKAKAVQRLTEALSKVDRHDEDDDEDEVDLSTDLLDYYHGLWTESEGDRW